MQPHNIYLERVIQKNDIIEQIKKRLYEDNGNDNWKEFVDGQSIGECQSIVYSIVHDFKKDGVKRVFGEIDVEEPYTDEDGDEQDKMTHHWVEIDGVPYDFSKGTLTDYIHFGDIYNPEIEDKSIYHAISGD